MSVEKGKPIPYKWACFLLFTALLLVGLLVDFREVYLKSWIFEFFSPTHSVELSISRVRK